MEGFSVEDDLIAHALHLLLDDGPIGKWAISEVEKRLGRIGAQDREYWQTYTAVINELIGEVLKRNQKAPGG
jgi:hypothetical protein